VLVAGGHALAAGEGLTRLVSSTICFHWATRADREIKGNGKPPVNRGFSMWLRPASIR
jgi:hypothetical protein